MATQAETIRGLDENEFLLRVMVRGMTMQAGDPTANVGFVTANFMARSAPLAYHAIFGQLKTKYLAGIAARVHMLRARTMTAFAAPLCCFLASLQFFVGGPAVTSIHVIVAALAGF